MSASKCGDEAVNERDDDQGPIQSVPVVGEVIPTANHEPCSQRFHQHLDGEDQSEHVVRYVQYSSLCRP